jgi:hypothetical protein
MEWVASTLHTIWNMVYPALLPLMRTARLPVVDGTDAPADLNGLVRFAETRNLVSVGVPSHFKRSLPHCTGGRVGLRAVLDRCGIFRPHRVSISEPSIP